MIPFSSNYEPEAQLIRVLIVDDMPQVRQDLRVLLQLSNEIQVVGEAADGQEAITQAKLLNPDVVIMDLEMPILDGIQATSEIKQHKFAKRVVILSVHSDPEDINRAMQAGADAFIQKGSPYITLIESIHPTKQQEGETY
jgi:NarL family two-component system response regulator LiaR